jgi:hypothetical protein
MIMTDSRETDGEEPQSTETGNTMLLAGGGFAAYGTTMAVTAGFVCSVCVVATPVLLGVGAYQKYKHRQTKNASIPENSQET